MSSPSAGTEHTQEPLVHHDTPVAVQNDTIHMLSPLALPLQTLQSAGPSASRLPAECLALIFMLVADEDRPSRWSPSAGRTRNFWDPHNLVDLGWLRITHVCRRWRQVALENPLLWTNVVFCLGKTWRDEFLRRVGGVPLTIALDKISEGLVTCDGLGLQDIISQHLDHTKALVLSRGQLQTSTDPMAPVLAALSQPAPMLEAFRVHNAFPVDLPLDLFAQRAPRLQLACLVRCSFSWPLPEFGNLVHLHIEDCRRGRGLAMEAPEMVDIERDVTAFSSFWLSLQQMPLLETLVLEASMPAVRSHEAAISLDSLPRISFHHLRKLLLKENVLPLGVATARLVYPSTSKQQMRVYELDEPDGPDGPDGVGRDVALLRGWLMAPSAGTIRKLTVHIWGWRHIEILLWTIQGEELALRRQHIDPPFIALSFYYEEPVRPLDRVALICNALPLHELELGEMACFPNLGLSQYGPAGAPHQFWHHAFGHCKNVRHFRLARCGGPMMLWTLCCALMENLREPLFPKLALLEVCADFGWNNDGRAPWQLGDVFLDMLTARAACAPLSSLDICASSAIERGDAWIDRVKALVPNVHLRPCGGQAAISNSS